MTQLNMNFFLAACLLTLNWIVYRGTLSSSVTLDFLMCIITSYILLLERVYRKLKKSWNLKSDKNKAH